MTTMVTLSSADDGQSKKRFHAHLNWCSRKKLTLCALFFVVAFSKCFLMLFKTQINQQDDKQLMNVFFSAIEFLQ